MSRVYFHSIRETAEVGGAERAYWNMLCSNITDGIWDIRGYAARHRLPRIKSLIAKTHYLAKEDFTSRHDEDRWAEFFLTAFHVSGDTLFEYKGHEIDPFSLMLNTALTVGNDAVKFAARLHGSCELHCWVKPENRAWLADIIEQGVQDSVLRKSFSGSNHLGYDSVIELLRKTDMYEGKPLQNSAVVCSYSVCEQFPDPRMVERNAERNECLCGNVTMNKLAFGTNCFHCGRDTATIERDEWIEYLYTTDKIDLWSRSFRALVERGGGLELKPDNWNTFRFGHKLSVLDIMAEDYEARLDLAIAEKRI